MSPRKVPIAAYIYHTERSLVTLGWLNSNIGRSPCSARQQDTCSSRSDMQSENHTDAQGLHPPNQLADLGTATVFRKYRKGKYAPRQKAFSGHPAPALHFMDTSPARTPPMQHTAKPEMVAPTLAKPPKPTTSPVLDFRSARRFSLPSRPKLKTTTPVRPRRRGLGRTIMDSVAGAEEVCGSESLVLLSLCGK